MLEDGGNRGKKTRTEAERKQYFPRLPEERKGEGEGEKNLTLTLTLARALTLTLMP